MFDFSFRSLSLILWAFTAFMYFSVSCSYFSVVEHRRIYRPFHRFIILFFITAIYWGVDGDYFNYQEWMTSNSSTGHPLPEKVYDDIVLLVGGNYFFFRIIVWGLALFFTLKTASNLKCNRLTFLFFIFALFINIFSYARASLAMSVYFCGLSYLVSKNKKGVLNKILGVGLIIGSYFFHHSMAILIAMTPFAYLPINKYTLLLILLLLPVIFIILKSFLINYFLSGQMVEDEYINKRIGIYSNAYAQASNWKGMIRNVFDYGRFYICLILSSIAVFKHKSEIIHKHMDYILPLYKVSLFLIIVASSFLFIGLDSNVFFYRLLYMSFIPLSIIISTLFYNRIIKKRVFSLILYFGILGMSLVFMASLVNIE